MRNKQTDHNLLADLSLLGLLTLFVVTTIYVSISASNMLVNLLYLGITALLVIATYFTGITTGLILNLLFIFAQGSYMLYQTMVKQTAVDFQLLFWLLMPLLLSVTVYTMTYHQQALQAENAHLKREKQQLSVIDEQTHLRTLTSYLEDAAMYMDTSRRYNLPLVTVVIRVRYYDQLKRLFTEQQISDLIKQTSDVIKGSTRGEDIIYLLDPNDLTWGALLYTDPQGAQIVKKRIIERFNSQIGNAVQLGQFEVVLQIGIAKYDANEMKTPHDLMKQGEKQLEYDV